MRSRLVAPAASKSGSSRLVRVTPTKAASSVMVKKATHPNHGCDIPGSWTEWSGDPGGALHVRFHGRWRRAVRQGEWARLSRSVMLYSMEQRLSLVTLGVADVSTSRRF